MAGSDIVHVLAKPEFARTGQVDRRTVCAAIEAEGHQVELIEADSAEAAEAGAKNAVDRGAERLVVVGGDGMVHIGVQAVAETPTVLGVVPIGTGNDFAGALGIGQDAGGEGAGGEGAGNGGDVAADARNALREPLLVDLLRIGDRWAASVATFGFAADVNRRANAMRWPRGQQRYSLATLAALPGLTTVHYDLVMDGRPVELDAVFVTIANTARFGGGMQVSPAAVPTDGVADLTVVGDASRLELLRFFRNVYDGSHLDHPKVTTYRATTVAIETPGVAVWADGEPVAVSPVEVAVVPNALRLANPRPTP